MFDQLTSLDTSRTTWRVMVRVTRMWPSVSSSSDSNEVLKGYNLILLDDNNSHIQAYVYSEKWKTIASDMVEGGIYIITNFYTRQALGTLKPTSSKFIINFSNSTTVERIKEDDFMIPMHKFEFVDLSELFSIANSNANVENPEFSTDVIGVVEDFESVRQIKTMYGERDIVKFRITDGRYSHKVTVWGNLAIATDKSYHEITEDQVIGIVSSTKMKIFKSSVQLSTLPSSKIYLNLDSDYVRAMRRRLDEEGYKAPENNMSSPVTPKAVPIIQTLTLQELAEKTTTDDIKKLFLCVVRITNVEQISNWWYWSCIDCEADVMKVEGRFKCTKCPKTMPVPEKRYKIVVIAADPNEAYNFILMDRAAKRLLRKTATRLISENEEAETKIIYPDIIKSIVGKDVTLKIEICDDNVLLNSKIFIATDAYDDSSISASSSSASVGGYTPSNFGDNMIDLSSYADGETPISAKSSSKKIKMEK